MADKWRRRVVLDVRVVTGSGGGPDETILNSPRFLELLGYRMECDFLRALGASGFVAIRSTDVAVCNAPVRFATRPIACALLWLISTIAAGGIGAQSHSSFAFAAQSMSRFITGMTTRATCRDCCCAACTRCGSSQRPTVGCIARLACL